MEITIQQIEAILDTKVRPALAEHNGDVLIQSLEDHVLKVKLTGKCSGCPAAHSTNEELLFLPFRTSFW